MAHSAQDFREPAALAIAGAVWRGELDGLANQAAALDSLPARPALRLLWKGIDVAGRGRGCYRRRHRAWSAGWPPLDRGLTGRRFGSAALFVVREAPDQPPRRRCRSKAGSGRIVADPDQLRMNPIAV
jgi:hypothetical protein